MNVHKYSKRETKILCEEIKKKYSILDYVRAKGIPVHDKGNRHFIICPFHGDTDPSLSIEKHGDIELFYCFGCKQKGTIIDFYAEYEHVGLGGAIEALGDGIEFDFDIMDLLEEFEEKEKKTSIAEMNIAISIHCFDYLSALKGKISEDAMKSEFGKMDLLLLKIDNLIEERNEEEIASYFQEICHGNFLTDRLKKLEITE